MALTDIATLSFTERKRIRSQLMETSKLPDIQEVVIPPLLEIQKRSYHEFLQPDTD